jgi:small-conductance mechanosensitive channel
MADLAADWSRTMQLVLMPWIALLQHAPWVEIVVQAFLLMIVVLILHHVVIGALQRIARHLPFSRRIVWYGDRAGSMVVYLLLLQVLLRNNPSTSSGMQLLQHLCALFLITALTWLAVRCVSAVADTIIELNPADVVDNLRARRIQTQTKVLARTVMVVIILVGSGMALMTLPLLRQIGTSLLASAGVAGLVVGFAAKPVVGNLLAGLQLALTQPIRLEDVVIIENEWGQVEEITGSYVVVRIWDQRRMVVPLQWFIEHPFQNWTRTNSELLGTVIIWVDFRMPTPAVRAELERLVRMAPEWDGRVCLMQVTDADQRAMQLRMLVSAGDAGRCWDLRCKVREGLIDFIQREYPQYLPQLRTRVPGNDELGKAQQGPI